VVVTDKCVCGYVGDFHYIDIVTTTSGGYSPSAKTELVLSDNMNLPIRVKLVCCPQCKILKVI
jgi:hypothetical protein